MTEPTKVKISILGPLGTYTHEAAFKYFGTEVEYCEERTITDVFLSLSYAVPFGVVPQENSIFGSVTETYDVLRKPDTGVVCGEVTLAVQHCLLVRRGVKLEDIEQVLSHEQALGQCSGFLRDHLPNATIIKTPSTASAAQVLLSNPSNCAAICSKICATLFKGLETLHEGIQNERSNFTRFYVLSHQLGQVPPTLVYEPFKRALLRAVERKADQHLCVTSVTPMLLALRLDIARIDRRPSLDEKPFHNIYFIELQSMCEGDQDAAVWAKKVKEAVSRVREVGALAEVVGIW